MNCQQVVDDELVERYLNGQLEAALQDGLEVHILECPHCLEHAEALRLARAGLAERAHEIRRFSVKRALHPRLAWLGVAAAAVVVCSVVWYQFRYRSGQPQQRARVEVQSLHPVTPPVASQGATQANTHGVNAGAHVAANTQAPDQTHPAAAGTNQKREPKAAEIATGAKPEQAGPAQATHPPVVAEQHSEQKNGATSDLAAKRRSSSIPMSEEQAVELYSLATVQPPAYSFAGLAALS